MTITEPFFACDSSMIVATILERSPRRFNVIYDHERTKYLLRKWLAPTAHPNRKTIERLQLRHSKTKTCEKSCDLTVALSVVFRN